MLYASGSGVYGDIGETEAFEDLGPLIPVSTYGASKLAGEALLASYCAMFGLTARAFRFGNVVGPRQTHGVGFDFLRRLRDDPTTLRILGDGTQSKSYIHVFDVIDAVLLASTACNAPYEVFNVATGDYITVSEIAELAVGILGLDPEKVTFDYTGGDRGWKGDVPIVRIATDRIRALGWSNRWSSAEALERAIPPCKLTPNGAGFHELSLVENSGGNERGIAMTDYRSEADLRIKVFADGADLKEMLDYAANPLIKGFTTNPTLMHKAGITDYLAFAREVLTEITDRPISFEVFRTTSRRWLAKPRFWEHSDGMWWSRSP